MSITMTPQHRTPLSVAMLLLISALIATVFIASEAGAASTSTFFWPGLALVVTLAGTARPAAPDQSI